MKQNSSHRSWQEIARRLRIPTKQWIFEMRTVNFSLFYLQQSFFLTKMALKIFQKKFPINFVMVIIAFILSS